MKKDPYGRAIAAKREIDIGSRFSIFYKDKDA
jgi:hypothetical protein